MSIHNWEALLSPEEAGYKMKMKEGLRGLRELIQEEWCFLLTETFDLGAEEPIAVYTAERGRRERWAVVQGIRNMRGRWREMNTDLSVAGSLPQRWFQALCCSVGRTDLEGSGRGSTRCYVLGKLLCCRWTKHLFYFISTIHHLLADVVALTASPCLFNENPSLD